MDATEAAGTHESDAMSVETNDAVSSSQMTPEGDQTADSASVSNDDTQDDSRLRRRRSTAKAVKYAEDEESDEEKEIVAEKKRRARQLESELRVDVGHPLLEQIVGRRINKTSGAAEFLCKFFGRSYLHLWWLTFEEFELFVPEGYQKCHRVHSYERKLRRDGYQDLDDVDDVEANKVTVEKILSHKIDPREVLDEQIDSRRKQTRVPMRYPRVTDYFLLDNADGLPERLAGIVQKLMNESGGEIFAQPVDTDDVPDYLNIISTPMDLGTIAARLSRESYYIGAASCSLFASDVRLVFENCMAFNAEGSEIWNVAKELLKTFEKWLYDWILAPSAWLKLEHTGNAEKDRKLAKAFREEGEDCYDLWLPWQTGCSICRSNADSEQLLLCDRCDGEIHMFCSTPEITELPEGEWYCSYCQVRKEYEEKAAQWKKDFAQQKDKDESTTTILPVSPKPKDKAVMIPNILSEPVDGEKKFNRNKKKSKSSDESSGTPTVKNRATFFLVKWVGLSIRYSTWERPDDIGDDEQIQRYFKFSRLPTIKEIRETTCQLPCCARRNQLLLNSVAQKCCDKDRFCTRGFQHDGDCSREIKRIDEAYGTTEYRRTRMAEQIKTQLFAFHCLLNNHAPDKEVLKQCGMHSNAQVCKRQYLYAQLKHNEREDGDEDYSEDENDDESSEDDYEDEVDEDDFGFRRPTMFPGMVEDNDSVESDEDTHNTKKIDDEVSEVLGALVEHVALGYETKLEPVKAKVSYNSRFAPTSFNNVPFFTEYCVALRRTPFGLGMRLGIAEDGNSSVLGFQPLQNGMIGPAQACQVIAPGDILVAVNNMPVRGMTFKSVVTLISRSPEVILFHLHSQRPPQMYPPFCQARYVVQQREVTSEYAANESEYIPFSFNKYKPMLKVGVTTAVSTPMSDHANYITPTGPMQHLYAGIVDNSIDPHEHFASFLPEKAGKQTTSSTETTKDKKNEFIPYEHSPTFKGGRTLRSYQVEGLNWMITCWKAQRSCILADEMGLGKTVQVVSLIEHLRSEESIRGPYLVVVPLSTIQHWRREIESWTDLNVCVYHDIGDHRGGNFTAKDMRAVIRNQEWYYPGLQFSIFKFHILLTTYETILADFEEFEPIHWRLVVVDEAHRLKSAGSRVLKQMRVLNCDRKLLLTGTPLQNNTQELWVLLNYLEPVKFDNMEDFNEKFGTLESQEQVVQLQKLLSPYILRRVKEDVEKSIPPKEETIVSVELTTLQKQYYRAIYDKNKSFLYRGTKNSLPTLNNIQLQLRKCCNHPFLIKGVEERELEEVSDNASAEEIMEKTVQCSGKMVLVSKLLPKLKREGHKVLVFSQFLKQLDLLEQYCEVNGFGYERLDGTTSGSIRQNAIDRFSRANSKTFVFLLSTKAGGVGINLIAADTVIIFDSDWNPQNDLQAQARCHRIGQKKSVQIYRLVTRNTYESEMFERASRKLGLEHAVLGTASFNDTQQIDKPTAEQLVELLKRGAYALMGDDDTASKQFAERDIETILKENAHVRVMGPNKTEENGDVKPAVRTRTRKSLGGIAFGRSSFVAEGSSNDVSVDDPNFWEKVLPGAMSVEMLSMKLEDGSALASRQSKIKFINNLELSLNELVQDMKRANDDDSQRLGINSEHEYDIALQVLNLLITKHKKEFSTEQMTLVKGFLGKLEKSRVRSCRISKDTEDGSTKARRKKTQNGTASDASSSEDDSDEGDGRRRRKGVKRARKKAMGTDKSKETGSNGSKRSRAVKKRKTADGFVTSPNLFTGGVINDSDDLCTLCGDGGLILLCDGPCHRSFHLECIGMDTEPEDEHWLCPDCAAGRHMCLICKQVGEMGVEFGVIQCSVAKCGRFYHKGCLAKHPRVEWVGKKRFRCPSHFCHGCSQESQLASATKRRQPKKEPVVSCIHCAQSFHPKCIPSSEQYIRLSTNLMICANHLRPAKPVRKPRATADAAIERGNEPQAEVEDVQASSTGNDEHADDDTASVDEKRKPGLVAEKLCGFCGHGEEAIDDNATEGGASTSIEGPFIEQPVRLQFHDRSSKLVYVHLNCALHSPEVFVKPDGTFCNLTRAIKRGKQLKCTACKQPGATVGCVVEKCRCNYHLRCAVESGGEFIGSPYSLYCKAHAEDKHKEPTTFCTCGTSDADDRSLSLACRSCGAKFHPKCVNMSERQATRKTKDKSWICATCTGESQKDASMTRTSTTPVKRHADDSKGTDDEPSTTTTAPPSKKRAAPKRRRVAAPIEEETSAAAAPPATASSRPRRTGSTIPAPPATSSPAISKAPSVRKTTKTSKRTAKSKSFGKAKAKALSLISPHEQVSDSTLSEDDEE